MDGHRIKMDMTVTKNLLLHQVQAQNKPINDICNNKKRKTW